MRPGDSSQAQEFVDRHRPLLAVALRFLLGGALNTGTTLLLYWSLLYFIKYQWAYLISYCAGILLSYFLNTRYVFRTQHTWLRFAIFPLIYVVVYALGALTLKFCVDHLRVPATLGPLLSIAVTLPVSFVLTRILLRSDSSAHSQSKTSA